MLHDKNILLLCDSLMNSKAGRYFYNFWCSKAKFRGFSLIHVCAHSQNEIHISMAMLTHFIHIQASSSNAGIINFLKIN